MNEVTPPLGIAPADWDATPPAVRTVVLALLDQGQTLQARVTDLEARLSQYSGNSSRPLPPLPDRAAVRPPRQRHPAPAGLGSTAPAPARHGAPVPDGHLPPLSGDRARPAAAGDAARQLWAAGSGAGRPVAWPLPPQYPRGRPVAGRPVAHSAQRRECAGVVSDGEYRVGASLYGGPRRGPGASRGECR